MVTRHGTTAKSSQITADSADDDPRDFPQVFTNNREFPSILSHTVYLGMKQGASPNKPTIINKTLKLRQVMLSQTVPSPT